MNTHLHILEAYTNLYVVWKSPHLERQLDHLLEIFCRHIVDPETNHFRLFFDRDWKALTGRISFGHDIEGSWLLDRAAEILNHPSRTEIINPLSLRIAQAVLKKGMDYDFGLLYESDGNGHINAEKHFWCQAEAVILNPARKADRLFILTRPGTFGIIENYQIDKANGEWFWKLDAEDGGYVYA